MSPLIVGWVEFITFLVALWVLAAVLDRVWPSNYERQHCPH
jgi:hypothetical protein